MESVPRVERSTARLSHNGAAVQLDGLLFATPAVVAACSLRGECLQQNRTESKSGIAVDTAISSHLKSGVESECIGITPTQSKRGLMKKSLLVTMLATACISLAQTNTSPVGAPPIEMVNGQATPIGHFPDPT